MVVLNMINLIHTLDVYYYGIAILITCSIGCSNISNHLYSRWLYHKTENMIRVHWVVKLLIIIWGLLFVDLYSLFQGCFWAQIISLFPAIMLGILAVHIEIVIHRRRSVKRRYASYEIKSHYTVHQTLNNKTNGLSVRSSSNKVNLKNVHEFHARFDAAITHYTLLDIIIVAACEEIIYRGFLWKLAFQLNCILWTICALLCSVVLFGASHLSLGKGQFLSKTILGGLCMIGVLIVHSVIPAIVTHLVFNISAYRFRRPVDCPRDPVVRTLI